MLSIEACRGFGDDGNVGNNVSFYLYFNANMWTISPFDFGATAINYHAILGYFHTHGSGGVLRYLHELCYELILDRGWVSDENLGSNISFYLCISVWYHMLSPHSMRSDSHASLIHIDSFGWFGNPIVDQINGGVQLLGLCY